MTTVEQPNADNAAPAAPSLLRQIGHYLGGQVGIMAAGFISMPILTRAFSQYEYGIMSLVSTMLMLLTALSKGGLPPAAVRFAGRPEPGQESEEKSLQSSLLLAALASSLFFAGLITLVAWVYVSGRVHLGAGAVTAYHFMMGDRPTARVILVVGALVVPRTISSVLWALMRSEQRSKLYNACALSSRYASLVIGIGAYLAWRTLTAYFLGVMLAEGLVVFSFAAAWWRAHGLSVRFLSRKPIRMALAYGVPLIGYEITSLLVAYCDKYIIQFYKGAEAVGRYAAGYGVAEVLPAVLAFPIELAIMPHCFRLWEREGAGRTGEFVGASAARYAVVAFPTMALFCAVSKTILVVMASAKYAGSASVIPWVVAGQVMWQAFCPLVGMGFYVQKKTSAFTVILLFALFLNAALNFILVPRMNFYGAAVATFATYAVVIVLSGIGGARYLHVKWPWASLVRSAVVSVGAALAAWALPLGGSIGMALVRVALGAALYVRLTAPYDPYAAWVAQALVKGLGERGLKTGWLKTLTGI